MARSIINKIYILIFSIFILAVAGMKSPALAEHVKINGSAAEAEFSVDNGARAQINFTVAGSYVGADSDVGYGQRRDPSGFSPAASRDINIEKWTTSGDLVQDKIRIIATGIPVYLLRFEENGDRTVFATGEEGTSVTQIMKPLGDALASIQDPVPFIFFHQYLTSNESAVLTCNGAYPEFCPAGHHIRVLLLQQIYQPGSEIAVDHVLEAMHVDPDIDPCALNIPAVKHVACDFHGYLNIELID